MFSVCVFSVYPEFTIQPVKEQDPNPQIKNTKPIQYHGLDSIFFVFPSSICPTIGGISVQPYESCVAKEMQSCALTNLEFYFLVKN